MEKLFILAYMGTGKTELEKRYDNVVDLDFQDYKFIYDISVRHLPLEQRKGNASLRTENIDYPKNFINAVLKELNNGKIVVSPFIEHVFKAVDSNKFSNKFKDVKIILVFPTADNFQEYVERFKNRGNGEEFIERRRKEFPSLVELFNNALSKKYIKIEVKPNKFLSDALEEVGIKLKPLSKNN